MTRYPLRTPTGAILYTIAVGLFGAGYMMYQALTAHVGKLTVAGANVDPKYGPAIFWVVAAILIVLAVMFTVFLLRFRAGKIEIVLDEDSITVPAHFFLPLPRRIARRDIRNVDVDDTRLAIHYRRGTSFVIRRMVGDAAFAEIQKSVSPTAK